MNGYTVIVCTRDKEHSDYICKALYLGCNVITEKPMTIDATKCQQIIDAVKKTGKSVRVTFTHAKCYTGNEGMRILWHFWDQGRTPAATDSAGTSESGITGGHVEGGKVGPLETCFSGFIDTNSKV